MTLPAHLWICLRCGALNTQARAHCHHCGLDEEWIPPAKRKDKK